ncbi:hypothetical protein NHQ30_000913 [Ciborinia camelliae]|nr:hypothetical protein NHQ30_000913 [Ciborinia camelliae]
MAKAGRLLMSTFYMCADITFSSNTTALQASDNSTQCPTTPGITIATLTEESNTTSDSNGSSTTPASSPSSSSKSSGSKSASTSLSALVVLLGAVGIASLLII